MIHIYEQAECVLLVEISTQMPLVSEVGIGKVKARISEHRCIQTKKRGLENQIFYSKLPLYLNRR